MPNLSSLLPSALAAQARSARLGTPGVPALLAHPDWSTPRPTVLWMHGRTATKELDPGRYLRWIRAGIAAVALDLPGHGERADVGRQKPEGTLGVLAQMLAELDHVVEALADPAWNGVFDLDRLAIGGMSAGGMVTLRRLCDEHPFVAAAVECTTGDLGALYEPRPATAAAPAWPVRHDPAQVEALDPIRHLQGAGGGWRPIPLLVLHTVADRVVPITGQRGFVAALRRHYAAQGADPDLVQLTEFPENGSPDEHAGFGRLGNDAKNAQTAFLARVLGVTTA